MMVLALWWTAGCPSRCGAPVQHNARTVAKWVDRFQAEGKSRACRTAHQGPSSLRQAKRRRPYAQPSRLSCDGSAATAKQIAVEVGVAGGDRQPYSAGALGLNRLSALEPAEPIRR